MLEANRIVTVTMHPAIDQVIEARQLQLGRTCKGRLLGRYPAGKGINVSRVAAILGVDSIATGFVGAEELEWFEAHLADYGCSRAQLLAVRGETRHNLTLVDGAGGSQTHVRTSGFAVSADNFERLRRKLTLLAAPGTTIVFAGSLPPGVEAKAFAELVGLVGRRGADTVVDTSEAALQVLSGQRLSLLKVNREELAQLTGEACADIEDTAAAAAAVLGPGWAEAVVVTLAAQGALLIREQQRRRAWLTLAQGEAVANTVGCGDAFLAGLLLGGRGEEFADRTASWEAALRLAVAAATASALTSRAALVDRETVAGLRDRVEFESV
ncbi:MAG: 1-phosphofructokinase family hexose kinase [Phycisphaerales bacterium JB038]